MLEVVRPDEMEGDELQAMGTSNAAQLQLGALYVSGLGSGLEVGMSSVCTHQSSASGNSKEKKPAMYCGVPNFAKTVCICWAIPEKTASLSSLQRVNWHSQYVLMRLRHIGSASESPADLGVTVSGFGSEKGPRVDQDACKP
jgi:hypothetical protein